MRAAVVDTFGTSPRYGDVAEPTPTEHTEVATVLAEMQSRHQTGRSAANHEIVTIKNDHLRLTPRRTTDRLQIATPGIRPPVADVCHTSME